MEFILLMIQWVLQMMGLGLLIAGFISLLGAAAALFVGHFEVEDIFREDVLPLRDDANAGVSTHFT